MTTGEMMIYGGIALTAVSFLVFIIVTIVFSARKKKLIKKIYGETGG